MSTKKRNRRFARKALRQANKNVEVDVGTKQSRRHTVHHYGCAARASDFAKIDLDA